MERLTKRNEDGNVVSAIECPNGCKYLSCSMVEGYYCDHQCEADVMCKLADYEDAEEQGLLLRLPCKVGDTVYTNLSSSGWYFRSNDRPYPAKVVFIGLNNAEEFGGGFINVSFDKKAGCMMQFRFSDIGELVFLTKEEAEMKLAGFVILGGVCV